MSPHPISGVKCIVPNAQRKVMWVEFLLQ
uniref:Uncharacterized protein n=1 Tax=Rhizophora mucronata TaxID=61149 RepID=A0A2P2QVF8_RHIMU